jgi:hypothetical protein
VIRLDQLWLCTAPMDKCKKADIVALQAPDDAVIWICPKCQSEGRISNW